jgi:hypothetical protein
MLRLASSKSCRAARSAHPASGYRCLDFVATNNRLGSKPVIRSSCLNEVRQIAIPAIRYPIRILIGVRFAQSAYAKGRRENRDFHSCTRSAGVIGTSRPRGSRAHSFFTKWKILFMPSSVENELGSMMLTADRYPPIHATSRA